MEFYVLDRIMESHRDEHFTRGFCAVGPRDDTNASSVDEWKEESRMWVDYQSMVS